MNRYGRLQLINALTFRPDVKTKTHLYHVLCLLYMQQFTDRSHAQMVVKSWDDQQSRW